MRSSAIQISSDAQEWQKIAREYADEYLQPLEVEAELNDGELPAEITKRNKSRAIELGFTEIDARKSHGGRELAMESPSVTSTKPSLIAQW